MKHKPLRVGVAGAGHWGTNLIRTCADVGVLAAVCEPDPTLRGAIERSYSTICSDSAFSSFLARDIDAVVLATPASSHADLALEAIAAGKHVFVEKPLALEVARGLAVVEAAARAKRVLFVGHLLRYHPAVVHLLSLIDDGSIGTPLHVRTRRLSLGRLREEENVWWSFAPHDISLVLSILGGSPLSVEIQHHALFEDRPADFAYADLRFPNGRSAHIEVGWLDPEKCSQCDVFGTAGVARFADFGSHARVTICATSIQTEPRRQIAAREAVSVEFANPNPLRCELAAFVACVEQGLVPITNGAEAMAVLRVLAAGGNLSKTSTSEEIVCA